MADESIEELLASGAVVPDRPGSKRLVPAAQSVVVPVEPTELVNRLVQELAPDQGQSASTSFGLALELQGAIAVPTSSAALRADLNNYVTRCIRSTPEADMSLEEALIARAARALSAPAPSSLAGGEATWVALDENGSAELRVNGQRITTFPSYGGAEEAASRINAALSPEAPAREGVVARVMDRKGLTDALTPGHPDTYLNAILDYTAGFYGEARKAGMPAASVADAMNHVERAARGLHALALTPRHEAFEEGEPIHTGETPSGEAALYRDLENGIRPLTAPRHEAPACSACGGKGYTEHEGGDGEGYPSRPEIEDCPKCHEAPASHAFEASHSIQREGGCKVCGHDEASHEAPASEGYDEAKTDAWNDFEGDHLTDGNGYATAEVYRLCREAFDAAWPQGRKAASDAALSAFRAKHEVPAEGAGERDRLIAFLKERDEACGTVDADDAERAESSDMILALRARSSAPEAREGEAVGHFQHSATWNAWEEVSPEYAGSDGVIPLYRHPAAPSADKLRSAVEALSPFARACLDRESQNVKTLPGGASVRVTLAQCRTARQALAVLKAGV